MISPAKNELDAPGIGDLNMPEGVECANKCKYTKIVKHDMQTKYKYSNG